MPLIAFFPIALNTIAGFGGRRSRCSCAARIARRDRAGRRSATSTSPARCRSSSTGLRIGFFLCFASVLGGETLSSAAGVGHAIAHAGELLEGAQMYAWIVVRADVDGAAQPRRLDAGNPCTPQTERGLAPAALRWVTIAVLLAAWEDRRRLGDQSFVAPPSKVVAVFGPALRGESQARRRARTGALRAARRVRARGRRRDRARRRDRDHRSRTAQPLPARAARLRPAAGRAAPALHPDLRARPAEPDRVRIQPRRPADHRQHGRRDAQRQSAARRERALDGRLAAADPAPRHLSDDGRDRLHRFAAGDDADAAWA